MVLIIGLKVSFSDYNSFQTSNFTRFKHFGTKVRFQNSFHCGDPQHSGPKPWVSSFINILNHAAWSETMGELIFKFLN